MTRSDENLDCVGGAPIAHAVAKELYDDALAALAVIAEMGDKTLIASPDEPKEVRDSYSLGAHCAFSQAAAVAKTVLEAKVNRER